MDSKEGGKMIEAVLKRQRKDWNLVTKSMKELIDGHRATLELANATVEKQKRTMSEIQDSAQKRLADLSSDLSSSYQMN